MKISSIKGREVLDSRGNPTVEVELTLGGIITASAIVPSGASTGEKEAFELRDGDKARYNGLGVTKAVTHVNTIIREHLCERNLETQEQLDEALIKLDGTANKSVLGANAILAVSLAYAKALAEQWKIPLFKQLHRSTTYKMPVPCMNVINGGKHADNNVDFQEFMIAPHNAPSFKEAIRMGEETFHALKALLKSKGYFTGVGDEGGFAPNLRSNEEAVEVILEAITKAGYKPGTDISLCLDPATSEMWEDGMYVFKKSDGKKLDSGSMIDLWEKWLNNYPIVLLEDPLGEHDWESWQKITSRLGSKVELVGDDIFCTNKDILNDGIRDGVANSILIKPNQIGTVTETLETVGLAYRYHYNCFFSHRSGETEDTSIADFAVSVSAGHLKTGSGCRGERIAKFNRLLRIEEMLGSAAQFPGIKAFKNQ